MAIGVRLKKSLNGKPRVSARRMEEAGDGIKSVDRRRRGIRESVKGRRSKYDSDGIGSDSEAYGRKEYMDRRGNSGGKGRRFEMKENLDFEPVEKKKKRADATRDVGKERKSLGVRGSKIKSLAMDEKYSRKDDTVARRGRVSDVGLSRRKPSYGKRRDFNGDDSDERKRSDGDGRALRGHRGKRDDGVGDVGLSGRKNSNGKRMDFDGDGRALRGLRGKRDDGVSYVGFSGRKNCNGKRRDFDIDDSDERKRSYGEARALRGHHRKRDDKRDFDGYDSGERRRSDGEARPLGGHRRKKDDSRGGKVSYKREERGLSVEESADEFRSKGKKMDGIISIERCKGEAGDELSDKHAESKDQPNQIAEQKHVRRLTRVLDKSGKKIRVLQKRSDDGSVVTDALPPKKKRRTMKIDPYDISNKRLDDGLSNSEKAEEEDTEISKNAQFRAIQPSPSILSFVEDNLLGRRRLTELRNAGYNNKLSAPLDNIPFSTSLERERIEENVFRNKLEFFAAAKISSSFPPPLNPEIAIAGRSNVGKSSLLNALTRQWGVVRTSDKPGYTQSINFFKLSSKLCLVDLPGYGFAYAKEEVKDSWEELVKEYVSTRVGLQRVCLLIDTKWGMKPRDHELIDLMERSQTPYQIVLTKTDVVFPIDVARRAMQIQENLKRNKSIVNPVMMVSSKSGAGIRSLRTVLAKIARFVKP